MHRPQKRAVKLWLPTDADRTRSGDAFEHENRASLADPDPAPEPEEDLDQLFAQYEQQAEADKSKVATAAIAEKPNSQKSMKELRECGLSQPIGQDTKGFQLLAKMGYKAGEGIGKDGRGRAAPLSVDLKAGRTGLGVDEEKKRKQHSYKQLQELRNTKRLKGQELMKDSYLTHQATSFTGRQAEQRLEEAQQVCETLDRRRGMTESLMWLVEPPLQEQDEPAEATKQADPGAVNPWAELPVAERLRDVLQRLRMEHSYCIFCGCQALPKKTIDPDHGETILPITDAQEPLISSTTLHGHSGPLGEWESDEIAAVGLCK